MISLSMPVIARTGLSVYLRLPRELWVPVGTCHCGACQGAMAYLDTLVVPASVGSNSLGETFSLHLPDAALLKFEAHNRAKGNFLQPVARKQSNAVSTAVAGV